MSPTPPPTTTTPPSTKPAAPPPNSTPFATSSRSTYPRAKSNSPSFSRRTFQTQLTVQDGDTVAIGGFIQDQSGSSTDGVPFLSRIPLIGGLFGAKASNKGRTELIVFLTPKVLFDTRSEERRV